MQCFQRYIGGDINHRGENIFELGKYVFKKHIIIKISVDDLTRKQWTKTFKGEAWPQWSQWQDSHDVNGARISCPSKHEIHLDGYFSKCPENIAEILEMANHTN